MMDGRCSHHKMVREKPAYQDDATGEDEEDNIISRIREASRINFQSLAICEEEVWIHYQA